VSIDHKHCDPVLRESAKPLGQQYPQCLFPNPNRWIRPDQINGHIRWHIVWVQGCHRNFIRSGVCFSEFTGSAVGVNCNNCCRRRPERKSECDGAGAASDINKGSGGRRWWCLLQQEGGAAVKMSVAKDASVRCKGEGKVRKYYLDGSRISSSIRCFIKVVSGDER